MKHDPNPDPSDTTPASDRPNAPGDSGTAHPDPQVTGQDQLLLEVICERKHCLLYDYAINTVDFVAEKFGERVKIKPVVRRGNVKNALRYLELCRKNRRPLSVPTILIDGEVVFTDMPTPKELEAAIAAILGID